MILAGGATPVEQKRRTQLIEDAINATVRRSRRVSWPGGVCAAQSSAAARWHDRWIERRAKQGAELLQRALSRPFFYIAPMPA